MKTLLDYSFNAFVYTVTHTSSHSHECALMYVHATMCTHKASNMVLLNNKYA